MIGICWLLTPFKLQAVRYNPITPLNMERVCYSFSENPVTGVFAHKAALILIITSFFDFFDAISDHNGDLCTLHLHQCSQLNTIHCREEGCIITSSTMNLIG